MKQGTLAANEYLKGELTFLKAFVRVQAGGRCTKDEALRSSLGAEWDGNLDFREGREGPACFVFAVLTALRRCPPHAFPTEVPFGIVMGKLPGVAPVTLCDKDRKRKKKRRRGNRMENKIFQVSTLQAFVLGYSRAVINVAELLREGDTGLGTFEDVNGEMIVLDGHCYRADQNGCVTEVAAGTGVPFATVASFHGEQRFELNQMPDIASIRRELDRKIEERFGLNSMHVVRIDGEFEKVDARSEAPYRSHHVTLKQVLTQNQKAFIFEKIRGSLVGVYFPDYMDGINMPGWHLHFLSEDRSKGGHVFEVSLRQGAAKVDRITNIFINLPADAAFDTYSLKQNLQEEIKSVE